MIKAIIFDCFGVLVESSYNNLYSRYLSDRPEVIERIKALDHASNNGSITHDDFYRGVEALTGLPESEIRDFMKITPINELLLHYIERDLKPHYNIGFLSNVASNLMDQLFSKEQQNLFDDVVLSFEVNLAKPDVRIFELAASRLGVLPSECVFIDDVQVYCEGAEAAGMKAIQYNNFDTFRREFEAILVR